MTDKTLNEPLLPDDYPIYADYCYVLDGKVVRSDWHKVTAAQFKKLTGATEVRRCDMIARGLKFVLLGAALALLAAPALAESVTKANADATALAAARASSGGGNSITTNFAGSRIPNNTPEVIPPSMSASGTECQLPGFSAGAAVAGTGAALGIPGGNDEECKTLRLAEYNQKVAVAIESRDPQGARRHRQTADELTCQIPRMKMLTMCAPSMVTASYAAPGSKWYCDNPAGYHPAVPLCSAWRVVP
jgi:hypothetical protein